MSIRHTQPHTDLHTPRHHFTVIKKQWSTVGGDNKHGKTYIAQKQKKTHVTSTIDSWFLPQLFVSSPPDVLAVVVVVVVVVVAVVVVAVVVVVVVAVVLSW